MFPSPKSHDQPVTVPSASDDDDASTSTNNPSVDDVNAATGATFGGGSVTVTPWEVALGRTVKAPTLGGPVDLKIPAGSSGTLRLKGRGLPGDPPGNQIVELDVVVPKADNDKVRELYEQLEKASHVNPRAKLKV